MNKISYKSTLLSLLIFLGWSSSLLQAQTPLKVFVLVGQSNMEGHAKISTLPHIGMDPSGKSMMAEMLADDGTPKIVDDVWISYLSPNGVKAGRLTTGFGADENKIGPELTFGIYMQKRLKQPVLIIKAAWGGKSINTDFRSPSAGPYPFDQEALERLHEQGKDINAVKKAKIESTGYYYRQTIDHVKSVLKDIKSVYPNYDPSNGYQLSGIVWFQGWNDMVDRSTYPARDQAGGYDAYSSVLANFIRDIRKDLSAPDCPFIIGVMGAGGPVNKYTKEQQRYAGIHQNFRDAMAAPASQAEFKDQVIAVLTENSWDLELAAILKRDDALRSRINQAKKNGSLLEIAKQLNQNKEFSDKDREDFNSLQKQNKLDAILLESLRTKTFTTREYLILKTGKSNAEYHYLGSGKILAQIGKSFADAIPLKSTNKR